ncbi:MAG: hypothetical protein JO234_09465, partial [Hyphomicrobiales bacterium]|nr:hypothetical protein [Hyphomicrobiales bacterium]
MSAFVSATRSRRALAAAAGLALAASVSVLTSRLAPGPAPAALGLVTLAAAGGLVATLETAALPRAAAAFVLGALVAGCCGFWSAAPEKLEAVFGVASLGLAASVGYGLAMGSGRLMARAARRYAALGAALVAALGLYAIVYV